MSTFVWYCIDCKQEIEDIETHEEQFSGHRYIEVVRVAEAPISTFIPDNIPTKEELQDPEAPISVAWENIVDIPFRVDNGFIYLFNEKVGAWLSSSRITLTFTHRRTGSRKQILFVGISAHVLSGYYLNSPCVVTQVSATAAHSKFNKSTGNFELGYLIPGTRTYKQLYSFTLSSVGTFEGKPLVEVPANSILQCWSLNRVYSPVVLVEVAKILK